MRFTKITTYLLLTIIIAACGSISSNTPSPYYSLSIDEELQKELPAECKKVEIIYDAYHQVIVGKLKTPGIFPLRELKLSSASDANQPIKGENKELSAGKNWIKDNTTNKSDIIYSLAICAQNGYSEELTWLKSGIAEYFRIWCGFRPKTSKVTAGGTYKDGGTITADFLLYIEGKYNINIVRSLYRSAKENNFSEAIFQELAEKDLTTLWKNYQTTLSK